MQTVIRRWYEMIGIYSVNGNEVAMADYIVNVLKGFGLEVHYSYFSEDTEHKRPSIWTVLDSGRAGKTMLLIGHLDAVDVNLANWRTNPFAATEIDGFVYGRGSMDMKGGLSCILSTVEYFASHRDEFNGRIMAECRYDKVAVGFRGRYSFEVTVRGTSAHASRYPAIGENALINAGQMVAAIEALPTLTHPHLKHGTWCVRYISGGNPNTLVVPDSCYIFVDRYVVSGETEETCIAQIQEAAENLGLAEKVHIQLKPRKSPYMQPFAIAENHPLVETLRRNFRSVTGENLRVEYDASVCDSNILAVSLNIPVVTFGPAGGNMHGDNEYGVPEQVLNCLEIYKKTTREMLS